jgi:parvulin-like peptidyl-prolyl isomerase
MKYEIVIGVLFLAGLPPVSAQLLSSHTPTQSVKPSRPSAPVDDGPVARVNGVVLTNHDLLREEYTIFPYARQHNGQIPQEMESGVRKGAMQMIIFEELVYQEALRRKMEISPAKLQQAEAEFRKQFSNPDEYQQYLQVEFQGSLARLRAKIRRSLLIDALLKDEVEARSVVSNAELRAFYNQNPKRFEYPESFSIQTISFMAPDKATPPQLQEASKRAYDTYPQAKATKSYEEFGFLAEKVSEDDYRVMMGDHKAVDRAKMAPQLVQALLNLKPGQVSDIIQIEHVYTIVRMNQHIAAGKRAFDEARPELQRELQKEKANQIRASFDKKLSQNAKIEVL